MATTFPSGFLWGASTASYQIEGAADLDGRGESIWDRFCRMPGTVALGETGDVACDHYHRYREDVALMARLGLKAYRFSIAWPRVLPEGTGAVNGAGLDFYDRLIDELLEAGIAPWPCLYHWDLPQSLEDRGGWRNREIARWFGDYAAVVAGRLADRVGHFATLNEPNVFTLLGHGFGVHAPGLRDELATLTAIHNINLAHGEAVRALRAAKSELQIGSIHAIQPVQAATEAEEDQAARVLYDALWNWVFPDAQILGRYPEPLASVLEPLVEPGDLERIREPLDFFGLNHYTRMRVRYAPFAPFTVGGAPPPEDAERTGMGWEIAPDGFREALVATGRRYPGLPIYVTESGAGYEDSLEDGACDDAPRVAYLARYLDSLQTALDEGADIRGYFVWSLLDNFEWQFGYGKRFGIIYVDYESQVRVPKSSYAWYRQVIEANRLPD